MIHHKQPIAVQQQREVNKLLEQRIIALEEKVGVIEVRQGEQEEEIRELKYDFRFFKEYLSENRRGWRVWMTFLVIIAVILVLSLVWLLAF